MNQAIKKNGVNFGLILAAFLVLRTVAIYAIDLELFINALVGITDLVVTIGLGILTVVKIKKAQGGFVTFKEAFTGFFITITIGVVIYSLFNILLFNVIDTEAKTIIQEKVISKTVETFKKINAPADMVKETIKKMRESDSFSPAQQLLGLALTILMYSIAGLITAVAMKKQDPFAGIKQDNVNNIGDE